MGYLRPITWSEDGDKVYGKASQFNNVDEFIEEVKCQSYTDKCTVSNIQILACISTLEGIGAEIIIPLSNTDVVIENYFVADFSNEED